MRYKHPVYIAVFVATGLALLNSCAKNGTEATTFDCKGIATGRPPLLITLEVRDNQNRDLLNPATTGHYDTAQIRQLNNGLLKVIQKTPVTAGVVYQLRYTWQSGVNTNIIKLNATDQDTITTAIETVKNLCSIDDNFKSFAYNGKPYVDSAVMSTYKKFIIIK